MIRRRACGKRLGSFMLRWMLGKTPWPEYTKAMMPKTSGSEPQLAAAVAAPAG